MDRYTLVESFYNLKTIFFMEIGLQSSMRQKPLRNGRMLSFQNLKNENDDCKEYKFHSAAGI